MSEQKFVLTFNGVNDRVELSKGFPSIEKAITMNFGLKEKIVLHNKPVFWRLIMLKMYAF